MCVYSLSVIVYGGSGIDKTHMNNDDDVLS